MQFSHKAVVIAAVIFSANVLAATEFPDDLVPGDVAKEFTSGKIYSGVPDNFPVPMLPTDTPLYVLGSIDNIYTQRLLLGTSLSGDAVKELLKTGYAAGGWVDVSTAPNSLDLCHDVLGALHFHMTAASGAQNRIIVNRSGRIAMVDPAMTCAEQRAWQSGGPATTPATIFRDAVPLLNLPTTPANPAPAYLGGFSSGFGPTGMYLHAESKFATTIPDYSLAELQDFFATQMLAKGWSLDGDFVGGKSASAVWFKRVPLPPREPVGTPTGYATDMLLSASLTLLNLKEVVYSVALTVTTGEQQSAPIGIRGIGRLAPL